MEVDQLDDADFFEDEEGGTRIGGIYIPPLTKPHFAQKTDGRRLIIDTITNDNFKSYHGKSTLGPFHHTMTGIFGPNGCGKSNTIDSLLFVFGFKSSQVRCQNVSKLIHTSAHARPESCTTTIKFVEIYDMPNNRMKLIPDSGFEISRTAFRNGSSFYAINGKKSQYRDVYRLLKKYNVDMEHNRFLILQGHVELIASLPPKGPNGSSDGMLEYIEEIIGTNRYKAPLMKITERIQDLSAERTEKENRCRMAEVEVGNLEEEFNKAVLHLKLENDHTRASSLLIQKQLYDLKQKLSHLMEKQDRAKQEVDKIDADMNEKKKNREEKEMSIKEENVKIKRITKHKGEKEAELRAVSKKASEIQANMNATNKRRKDNKVQLKKLKEKQEDLINLPEKNASEIEECKSKLEKLQTKKSALEEDLQKNYEIVETESKPLIEQRGLLDTELVGLKSNFDAAKEKFALDELELKILQDEELREARKYETLKASYEEMQSNLSKSKIAFEKIQIGVPQLQQELSVKSSRLMDLKQEQVVLEGKIGPISSEITEREKRMQTTMSNNRVLNALMQQKELGNICGILGRLGDLGAIDKKYDVAISTCCGRLDNIVVDSVDTAQTCIEFLRTNKVGVASFIALDKVSHWRRTSERRIETPENAPRLFDLVRVEDERILAPLYFALRNTLVANDLDQATRIAYGAQRHRVVTLVGDIIEPSGTMSGGGRTQIRGKMGQEVVTKTSARSSAVEKGVEELERQLHELNVRLNANQDEQERLERDVYGLKSRIAKNLSDRNKLSITIKSLSEQFGRSEEQLNIQRSKKDNTTTDPVKVAQLQEKIAEKRTIVEECENKNQSVISRIDEIKNLITHIHDSKVKNLQTKIKSTTKQITTLTNSISKLKVEAASSERNLKKVEKQMSDLNAEIESAEQAITKSAAEREESKKTVEEYEKQIVEMKTEIESIQKSTAEVQKEISAIVTAERELELVKVQHANDLAALKEKTGNVKRRIPAWEEKLKPLKLTDIPLSEEVMEPLETYTDVDLASRDLFEIQGLHQSIESQLKESKPNLSCIEEYLKKSEIYKERMRVLEEITSKFNEMHNLYEQLSTKRQTEFMTGFASIVEKLREVYTLLTGDSGGAADMELIDPMDPFSGGILYTVRPPQKTWKQISELSGGERTLSSLSLVFAVHYYRPSAFYFMDEIDAALDFRNVTMIANHIEKRTRNAQFVIISHRKEFYPYFSYTLFVAKADDATGVYMSAQWDAMDTDMQDNINAYWNWKKQDLPVTE